MARNVFSEELESCCLNPVTGFFRNGKCDTTGQDRGMHTVCVQMTDEFLEFAREQGNDLITPAPEYHFPGLKAGDQWCVCVGTVMEAIAADKPPRINLKATHASVLEFITLDALKACAVDA
ncbi:MAG: DUF2237 domain-containing protein [Lentisphaerae bacterium]|nr:DUF2237 domain-containing protein [Lentisphaerota bacterium]